MNKKRGRLEKEEKNLGISQIAFEESIIQFCFQGQECKQLIFKGLGI